MLAATQCGGMTPLSPSAQATLEKHLPGLPKRRLMQQSVQRRDASCMTGWLMFFFFLIFLISDQITGLLIVDFRIENKIQDYFWEFSKENVPVFFFNFQRKTNWQKHFAN